MLIETAQALGIPLELLEHAVRTRPRACILPTRFGAYMVCFRPFCACVYLKAEQAKQAKYGRASEYLCTACGTGKAAEEHSNEALAALLLLIGRPRGWREKSCCYWNPTTESERGT